MTATATLSIIQAIADRHLMRPYLAGPSGDLRTWRPWRTALQCLYGLPVDDEELVRDCTGRDAALLPADGFDTALFLTGRRSGKSRTAACIAAYEAVLSGREARLAPGERGLVAVVAPTRYQATVCRTYLRGVFNSSDILRNEIASDTRDELLLRNGVCVAVLAADWRTVRGFSLLACIVDEAAFLGLDAEAKVKSDTELIRAIQPSLATCGGRLIAISSPYARKGWCYTTHERNWGNDNGRTLVWRAPSRTMNPSLPQRVVDAALAEDMAAAKSEYFAEWRDDVIAFVDPAMVRALVTPGRTELLPHPDLRYKAFVDTSGGRADAAVLAIAHRDEAGNRKVVLDVCRRWPAPHSPQLVIGEMADVMRHYGCTRCFGDAYAGEWPIAQFRSVGIQYVPAEHNKAELYLRLLPRISDGSVELLDHPVLVKELCGLERRTRAGGKDIVDHPTGAGHHDDCANAVAGAIDAAARPLVILGCF